MDLHSAKIAKRKKISASTSSETITQGHMSMKSEEKSQGTVPSGLGCSTFISFPM